MRSYGQFCAVARALDLVGDRWTLLVARELLQRPCRFTDLLDGLPGIARNLLADRLRSLTDAGLVEQHDGRYVLTSRGEELRPVIRALAGFGAPELSPGAGDDAVRGAWVATALDARYPDDPGVRLVSATDTEVIAELHGARVISAPEALLAEIAAARR